MTYPDTRKHTVFAFYEHVVKRRDFTAAAPYLAPVLIQHRNDAADGADGLREFIDRMRAAYPDGHYEIKRAFTDGDYVILHVHVVREPGSRGSAHVDIFRLKDGKVAEHSDVNSRYQPNSLTRTARSEQQETSGGGNRSSRPCWYQSGTGG